MNKITEIISIGDELLIGQVVNTNASWMGNLLTNNGMAVKKITAISDSKEEILSALEVAGQRSSLVLVTGGLGPTSDDITKPTVCEFFETSLIENSEIVEDVRLLFAKRNLPLTAINRKQAEVPENCTVIRNPKGTAPGMHFMKNGVHFIFMPGVPYEMKWMMENYVLNLIHKHFGISTILKRTILTSGIGESFLADRIKGWEESLPENIKLAYLPSPGMVRLRLTTSGDSLEKMKEEISFFENSLLQIIPELIFGFDDDSMEIVIGKILKNKGLSISVAESCTGGKIGHLLTSVPGSSAYFKGGVIAYSNEVKMNVLNVKEEFLIKDGAVSEIVVKTMAENVRKLMNCDIGLATSGIAGPDGGSEEKPIGTVWIAIATAEECYAQKFSFSNDRDINISRASMAALDMVRKSLA